MVKLPKNGEKAPANQAMATRVILYSVQASKESAFQAWLKLINEKSQQFTGFVGMEIHQPEVNESTEEWVVVYRFQNEKLLKAWLDSQERAKAIAAAPGIFSNKQSEYTLSGGKAQTKEQTLVTSHKITPGKEAEHEAANQALNDAAQHFPGFLGCETFKPTRENNEYTTLVHFNNKENMERWLNSSERKAGREALYRTTVAHHTNIVGTGFGSWFAFNAEDGIAAPAWKQAMVVLSALFPLVMILSLTVGGVLSKEGVSLVANMFVANVLSTIALTWLIMPVFSRMMDWWLSPKSTPKQTWMGLFLMLILYVIEFAIFKWV